LADRAAKEAIRTTVAPSEWWSITTRLTTKRRYGAVDVTTASFPVFVSTVGDAIGSESFDPVSRLARVYVQTDRPGGGSLSRSLTADVYVWFSRW
jgi:hypothetical protein